MGITSRETSVGAWAFVLGVVLAIIIGINVTFIPFNIVHRYNTIIFAVLVLLGLFVGLMTKGEGKEGQTFMLAGALVVLVCKFGMDVLTGTIIGLGVDVTAREIFTALIVLFVPATIVVALKNLFSAAKV